MGGNSASILCVEPDEIVLESRCAVLKSINYNPVSASPRAAEVILRAQKFVLIVFSNLSDWDVQHIVSLADGAEVLVLDGLTMPSELLTLVSQRLNRQRQA